MGDGGLIGMDTTGREPKLVNYVRDSGDNWSITS